MSLKNLFVKQDSNKQPEKPAEQSQPAPVPYVPPPPYIPGAQPIQYMPLTPMPGDAYQPAPALTNDFTMFYEQLSNALDEANLPTQQDYMDLKQALTNMASLPIDEASKYKAAFATLQSVGCDITALLESFNYYNNVIDSEKHKFDEATQGAVSNAVLEKQKTVEQLTQQNQTNAEQIRQLTEQTNANAQQIAGLQAEISTSTSKIEQKKANFKAAYDKMKTEMESDKQKIQMFIGTAQTAPKTKKSTKK